jgi:hypothetical protein
VEHRADLVGHIATCFRNWGVIVKHIIGVFLLCGLLVGCGKDTSKTSSDSGKTSDAGKTGGSADKTGGDPKPVSRDEGRRHKEKAYSWVPPSGWQLRDFPGLKYKALIGAAAHGLAANLNVVDEVAGNMPLDQYVDQSITKLKQLFATLKVLKREPFITDSGLKGVKVTIDDTQQGKMLR